MRYLHTQKKSSSTGVFYRKKVTKLTKRFFFCSNGNFTTPLSYIKKSGKMCNMKKVRKRTMFERKGVSFTDRIISTMYGQ